MEQGKAKLSVCVSENGGFEPKPPMKDLRNFRHLLCGQGTTNRKPPDSTFKQGTMAIEEALHTGSLSALQILQIQIAQASSNH
jgi:hypothetical protein